MVQNAARATREVKFPNRQNTRAETISLFQEKMHSLKERLDVRDILLLFILKRQLEYLEQGGHW
jgi:hypothetical protein